MCKYCAKAKDENVDFENFIEETVNDDNGTKLFTIGCAIWDGPELYMSLFLGDYGEEIASAHIPIHYCPFCGEKLN